MTLQVKQSIDIPSFVAQSGLTSATATAAFPFDKHDSCAVGFATATIVSNIQALTIDLQHSRDGSKWDTIQSFSLTSAAQSVYGFESLSARPKPLLTYGRFGLGLTGTGAKAEWASIRLELLAEEK